MQHQVFISYAAPDEELVENFADRLRQYGVKVWLYSTDKTLSTNIWKEIENKIHETKIFAFAASIHSRNAEGQHRELKLVLDKVHENEELAFQLLPIVIGDLSFTDLPTELQAVNGIRLSIHTVASTAHKVARDLFPELFIGDVDINWMFPRPTQWLEVCNITSGIEEYIELNDQLYFRRISPMGLFECYSPRIDKLIWILPENVRPSKSSESESKIVPIEFRFETIISYESHGRRLLQTQ